MSSLSIKTETYCRTCLLDSTDMISLFENNLAQVLLECTSINVNSNFDASSKMICEQCLRQLQQFHNFRQKCLENQKILTKNKHNIKQEEDILLNDSAVAHLEYNNDDFDNCSSQNATNTRNSSSTRRSRRRERKLTLRIKYESETATKTSSKSSSSKIHKCPRCPTKFPSTSSLKRHILKHDSGTEQLKCPECAKLFFSAKMLSYHIKKCHPKVQASYSCDKCQTEFFTLKQLEKHSRVHSSSYICSGKPRLCPFCDKKVDKLRRHVKEEHANTKLNCKICDREFVNPTSFILHVDSFHPQTINSASIENVDVNTVNLEKIRESYFKKRELLNCTICGKNFKVESTLKAHMDRHSGIDPRQVCYICGKKFNNINTHVLKSHMSQRSYRCSYCSQMFDVLNDLREHSKEAHMQERERKLKTLECHLCGKKFFGNDNLRHHFNNLHNNVRPFECSICNKRFKKKHELTKHMNIHADVRPYACDMCDKKFRERTSLKVHVRRHTGVKPFACMICQRAFTCRKECNWHLKRVHNVRINAEEIKEIITQPATLLLESKLPDGGVYMDVKDPMLSQQHDVVTKREQLVADQRY